MSSQLFRLSRARVTESTLDRVSAAVMFVDRDLRITYANESTRQLFSKNADLFRTIWPQFDPNKCQSCQCGLVCASAAGRRTTVSSRAVVKRSRLRAIGSAKVERLQDTAALELKCFRTADVSICTINVDVT